MTGVHSGVKYVDERKMSLQCYWAKEAAAAAAAMRGMSQAGLCQDQRRDGPDLRPSQPERVVEIQMSSTLMNE